MQNLFLKLFFS